MTAQCNQSEAFASDLDDDQSRYLYIRGMCNNYRAYDAFEYRSNTTLHYVDNIETEREPDDARYVVAGIQHSQQSTMAHCSTNRRTLIINIHR